MSMYNYMVRAAMFAELAQDILKSVPFAHENDKSLSGHRSHDFCEETGPVLNGITHSETEQTLGTICMRKVCSLHGEGLQKEGYTDSIPDTSDMLIKAFYELRTWFQPAINTLGIISCSAVLQAMCGEKEGMCPLLGVFSFAEKV